MRTSQYPLFTTKKVSSNVHAISHNLMLRAGMIRKLSSGLYAWLPIGLRVLRKVENILRHAMNDIGAIEILLPIMQPQTLWEKSGRLLQYDMEFFKCSCRGAKKLVLGPTHEEVITHIIHREMFSYKVFPMHFYQIQNKFRDEFRPKYGVIRSREFLMKDSYSFHITEKSLETTYYDMYHMYEKILNKIGLKFCVKRVHSGFMGGKISHEFQAIISQHHDTVFSHDAVFLNSNMQKLNILFFQLNNCQDISKCVFLKSFFNFFYSNEVDEKFFSSLQNIVKVFILRTSEKSDFCSFIALMLRGDHVLDINKVEKLLNVKTSLIFANDADISYIFQNSKKNLFSLINTSIPIIIDNDIYDIIKKNFYKYVIFINIILQKKLCFQFSLAKKFNLKCCFHTDCKKSINTFKLPDYIEVAHIFQLGVKYSKMMGESFLGRCGIKDFINMGCYGFGITRLVAVVIEQNYDKYGILWPSILSPFDVAIIAINITQSVQVKEVSEMLYYQLEKQKVDVLFDDRGESPGIMFTDIDLLGVPHIIIVGDRYLNFGNVEYRNRKNRNSELVNKSCVLDFLLKKL
ncbi:MAG: proline--tRNA ligase [Candidatus Westeberhardia cardiocondylae]|nr:proline--tRNA ligase [Candidatus Westeberhardia cardiocondylae]